MIKSTGDKPTKRFLAGERVKEFEQFKTQIQKRLRYLNQARSLNELASRPSNRYHRLKGNLEGYHAISVNRQYRIIFTWNEETVDTYDVRITDYH